MTPEKRAKAQAISTLIRLGWSPPAPSAAIAERILDDMRRLGRHQTLHLTDRELDVLYLMADGRERNEIADTLHLSPETVKYYTTHVIQKLGARNKAHAVHLADQQGLLEAA